MKLYYLILKERFQTQIEWSWVPERERFAHIEDYVFIWGLIFLNVHDILFYCFLYAEAFMMEKEG